MPQGGSNIDVKKYYLIRSTRGASVLCRRAEAAPRLLSGGARYSVVDRPRRKSTVQWDGDDPYRMEVPILLDGWQEGRSVETDIATLNQMTQAGGDLIPPVKVFVDGALPVKGAKWVIESIAWGDMVIWTSDLNGKGFRLRQDATINLLQFIEPKVLQVNTPLSSFAIVVKAQETLAQIAADFNIAVEDVMKANGIRDSKSIKAGQHLIVPGNLWDVPVKP